ncbi:MAG TPA: CDP-glucose 4,6-dehydratase [Solirubrobacteraceae bacterium]|nr:CDP-glucose 4,6-dehydratase [Solirubrobacteraceae bacterium]
MKIAALVRIDPDFWKRRRVLVTGHTGFKGAWLSLWLQALGAEVTGVAHGVPTRPSLYQLADVGGHMHAEHALDVRDPAALRDALARARPEVVLHLAAQPMVRRSLRDPALTYEVNVIGTVNVLEAVREAGEHVRAVVAVTSDKCYENRAEGRHDPSAGPRRPGEGSRGFTEDDPLGGSDPYSSSKACAELVVSAYRRSFFSGEGAARLASARAGNVIGGGDWGEDRLLGDVLRAVDAGEAMLVRNPRAVRPWQHVLSPLGGYLLLAERVWREPALARAWNFGPRAGEERPVSWVLERVAALWDGVFEWRLDERANPPEAAHLALDSSAAERELGWRPSCDLEGALALTVAWHRAERDGQRMRDVSLAQIDRIMELDSSVGFT